ncbi:DUF1571 domain-containing protein, partial [Burkholderia contaminans]|uniref:DUF1571 domain-containing protein n=1 Tax=Burkholderia contaminans TaxID=488447 RepID=UPI0021BC2522
PGFMWRFSLVPCSGGWSWKPDSLGFHWRTAAFNLQLRLGHCQTPTGRPQFYAKKEVLGLDLHAPYFRTVESYDNDGKIFERIVIEKIAPVTLDDTAFDPKNPDYAF